MGQLHPIEEEYVAWSPASAKIMDRGRIVFPGGDTRASAHFAPYPLVMERGEGCRLYDADGHEIVDFMNNFTSLIHGHAHPDIVEAIRNQAGLGSAFAAPSEDQIALAELVASRVPSVEQIRFCSAGTEATLMAIRCARAATGRQKIMKMEGGYHGSYELAEVSLVPIPGERGDIEAPASLPVDPSIPDSALADTVVCPYNQSELAAELIAKHAHELAAVIVEPILGSMGMVSATREFLETLRKETQNHDIVLIFDEVITLRISEGGVQKTLGITPDLTAMGKIIGGGLPVGAIGGRRDLMQLFSPEREQNIFHASTFSGNALTMAAGYAAMKALPGSENERLNFLGEKLREGFNQCFTQHGIKARAIGQGSLTNIVFDNGNINDARDSIDATINAGHITGLLHLCMLMNGFASASRLMYCTSTPMDESVIEDAVTALSDSLHKLRPYIEQERPGLLV